MELILRDGWWSDSLTLIQSDEKRDHNAINIYNYFMGKGWTVNAIAGMCGNIWVESRFNPGLFENRPQEWPPEPPMFDYTHGIGLTQWTGANSAKTGQKLVHWAVSLDYDYLNGWVQCLRILREQENEWQWRKANVQNMTFTQFSRSTLPATTLSDKFERAYERAESPDFATRRRWAQYYYDLFKDREPVPVPDPTPGPHPGPEPPEPTIHGIPVWLLFQFRKRRLKDYARSPI